MAKRRRRSSSGTKRRGLLKWLLGLTALALIVATFLPTIIALTPLRHSVIAWASSDFKGTIRVEQLRLTWWSPIRAKRVTASDQHGHPLFEIEHVSTEKSLLNLLISNDLGKVVIDQVSLNLVLKRDGSNIEDALVDYLNAPSTGKPLPKCEVNWSNAAARITAQDYDRHWRLVDSTGTAVMGDQGSPLQLNMKGLLGTDESTPKPLSVSVIFGGDSTSISLAEGQAEIGGDYVEISLATPLFDRMGVLASMAGHLHGTASIDWSDWGNELTVSTQQARLQHLTVRSQYYLGNDTLAMEAAELAGSFAMLPEGWRAENLNAKTNLGRVTAHGLINLEDFIREISRGRLPKQEFQVMGEIDVTRVSAMLPATLRLHKDVKFENAVINFEARNWRDGEVRKAALNVESPRLAATRNGQPLTWDQPIRIAANAREQADELVIEQLKCHAEFINIAGQGNFQQADFRIDGDLQQLAEQLNQLFDLGELKIAGLLRGELGWDRSQARSPLDPFQIVASLHIDRPSVQTSQTRWEQPQLSVDLTAEARVDQGNNLLVSAGKAILIAGHDQLEATLLKPLTNPNLDSTYPVQINVHGGLDTWLAQMSPFITLDQVRATGELEVETQAYVSLAKLTLLGFQAELTQVSTELFGLRIREPKITFGGNLEMDSATGSFLLDQAILVSSTIAASGNSIRYQPQAAGGLEGAVAYRADLNRLALWFPQLDGNNVHWFGELTGQANLKYNGKHVAGQIEAQIKDLVAATPVEVHGAGSRPTTGGSSAGVATVEANSVSTGSGWQILWSESEVRLNSTLAVTADLNQLRLDSFNLESSALRLAAQGNISDLLESMTANIQGNWSPDYDKVNDLIAAYTGNAIRISGGESQAFNIRGPLFVPASQSSGQGNAWLSNQLRAETKVSWNQIDLFGLLIGPESATTHLANSALTIKSGAIPVSGGTVQLAPVIHFRGEAPTVVVSDGVIADRVRLTVQNSQEWLKYVAPVVADATSIEGAFSASTSGLRLPLANFNAARGDLVLSIHDARVGPGPLGRNLIGFANQLKLIIEGPMASHVADANSDWLIVPQQEIPVEIKTGRVIHRGMTFRSGETVITTHGSVGFDQSLDLVAEIPILDRWIGDRPYLKGLRGQKIAVPLTGTISSPRLDLSVLQNLTSQLVRRSAETAVQNELENLIQNEGKKLQDQLLKGILKPNTGGQSETGPPDSKQELLNNAINEGINQFFGPRRKQ